MGIPVIIGAALAAGALVRVAKGWLRNEEPRDGYCTWCGRNASHAFHEDGLTWKRTGPIAVLTGGIGTAVAGLVTRNVYRCASCKNLTLPCRAPRCTGMARSTAVYDYELCGLCSDSNNEHAKRAAKERSAEEQHRIAEYLRQREHAIRDLETEVATLRQARAHDRARIVGLLEHIEKTRADISMIQRAHGLPEAATP